MITKIGEIAVFFFFFAAVPCFQAYASHFRSDLWNEDSACWDPITPRSRFLSLFLSVFLFFLLLFFICFLSPFPSIRLSFSSFLFFFFCLLFHFVVFKFLRNFHTLRQSSCWQNATSWCKETQYPRWAHTKFECFFFSYFYSNSFCLINIVLLFSFLLGIETSPKNRFRLYEQHSPRLQH